MSLHVDLDFEVEFYVSPDGKWGTLEESTLPSGKKTRKWNGMIKQVRNQNTIDILIFLFWGVHFLFLSPHD